MTASLKDVLDSLPVEKKRTDPVWTRLVLRALAVPIAWVFLRLGATANQVSYLAVLTSVLGSIALAAGMSSRSAVVGAVLLNVFAVLDCVDGTVARVRGTTSPYGKWVDALGGYVTIGGVFLSAGIAAERMKGAAPYGIGELNFVVIGALAGICNLTMRLQYQHFRNVHGGDTVEGSGWYRKVDKNLGIVGVLMPALLIGTLLEQLHWIVLFYAAFYLCAYIVATLRLIWRVEREEFRR